MIERAPLDADVAKLIAEAGRQFVAVSNPTASQIRESAALFSGWLRGPIDPTLDAVRSVDGRVGDMPVRWYGPEPAEECDVIVFLHGGGWVAGDLESYDPDVRLLQRMTGAAILAVEYRRTPEHPFPAALDDCVAAVLAAAEKPHRRLALVGDSAGGNLALGTALRVKDHGLIDALLALYPVVDPDRSHLSYKENGTGYLLTVEQLGLYWDLYTPTKVSRRDPTAALLTADLSGFPPTVIATADYDPLRDEGRALAQRLIDADVSVIYLPHHGLTHGFQQMVPRIPAATVALTGAYAALTVTLERAPLRTQPVGPAL